jgi:ABC-type molybdenum transport system ATPase subunit/photorepair protein PhrA
LGRNKTARYRKNKLCINEKRRLLEFKTKIYRHKKYIKEQGEQTMLEIVNLSKSYKEKKVLDNINLKLENGLYGLLRTKWSRKEYLNEYYNR